jgi:hypothetical protein
MWGPTFKLENQIPKKGWPDKFPIRRTLIAFLVIPPLSNEIMLFMTQRIGTEGIFTYVCEISFIAVAYSWIGYMTFLLLGLPALYLLHRLNWSNFFIFALIGALYTVTPWLLVSFRRGPVTPMRVVLSVRGALLFFGLFGVFNGLLTRLIVLGRSDGIPRANTAR